MLSHRVAATMDERIFELIEQWEDACRAGRELSAENLCRGNPEFLKEVAERIDALRGTAWMDKPSAVEPAPADPLLARSSIGRYRLDALVGQGGFGEVWRAFDPQLERFVAVKIPSAGRRNTSRPHGEPERLSDGTWQADKFLDEARKVARLKHPGIVTVHDFGQDDGVGYIVSDLVEGRNLAEMAQESRLPTNTAAQLVAAVADALDYAHRQGFVHRDVKPQNILVDEHGRPHLTDFGIAVSEERPARGPNATAGTLAYMSPEQAQGQTHKIDSRTDIYSLGVVLYELLAGRTPFVAKTPGDLWTAIISQSPRPLRTIDPAIPVALEQICLRALAKEPSERFSTAGDLAAALRAAAVSSGRPKWFYFAAALIALSSIGVLGLVQVSMLRQSPQFSNIAPNESRRAVALSSPQTVGQKTGPTQNSANRSEQPLSIPATAVRLDLTGRILSDVNFVAISRCQGLRELILSDTPTTDAQLQSLENCQGLRQLDLSDTRITDKATDTLEKLPALQDLSLARTRITDDAMDDLKDTPLRRLNLSDTLVTSDGIKDLADNKTAATRLEWLDLSDTAVDDTGVRFLRRLTRLSELRLAGTSVGPAAAAQLRAALPGCKIVTGRE